LIDAKKRRHFRSSIKHVAARCCAAFFAGRAVVENHPNYQMGKVGCIASLIIGVAIIVALRLFFAPG
jgi:hypothetical protein